MQYIRNSLSSLIYQQSPPESPDVVPNSPTPSIPQTKSYPQHSYSNGALITTTTNGPNRIIMTTTLQPQPTTSAGLSVIQEYDINKSRPYTIATRNDASNNLKVNEYKNKNLLPTPSDSYHSVLSDFPNDVNKMEGGITNPAYSHNESPMNTRHNPNSPINRRVTIRESYWTWHCCWETWTKREKILLLIVVLLTVVLSAVLGIMGLLIDRNRTYHEMIMNGTLLIADKSFNFNKSAEFY